MSPTTSPGKTAGTGTTSPDRTARPTLSRDVVADRAIELADAEGLEAVTIRRLATELGVTPMALYWHFRTKQDLLAGLADRVLDGVTVPDRTDDWAADLRRLLVVLVSALRPHPPVAVLMPERMLLHPVGRDLTERALASLAAAGFGPEPASFLAMRALQTAISMVTDDPVDDSGMLPAERDAHLRGKRAMIASLSPEQYPQLVAHAEAMTYCHDIDLFFDLGIDHYVAGVQGMAR